MRSGRQCRLHAALILPMITAKQLEKKTIEARDGNIGSVHDVYFDDQAWTIFYLVVDTGKWLPGRKVLLAPEVVALPWHAQASAVAIRLTKDQVLSSPDINTTQPVSREAERLLNSHYGWIPYSKVPDVPSPPPHTAARPDNQVEVTADTHLRSTQKIRGYRVYATDGAAGRIEDILFGDELRQVLFLAVDVEEGLLAKQVLIAPRLVLKIDWVNSGIEVDLPCRVIKSSQEYRPAG